MGDDALFLCLRGIGFSQSFNCFLQLGWVGAGNNDVGAMFQSCFCDSKSEPGCAPNDQYAAVLQLGCVLEVGVAHVGVDNSGCTKRVDSAV